MPYRASKRLDEIKMYCTAKLKQLYEELPWLKECSFTIKCPYHSRPGGPIEWRQEVSFKFDRSLYEKIDWGKFFYADILKVAEDVEFKDCRRADCLIIRAVSILPVGGSPKM